MSQTEQRIEVHSRDTKGRWQAVAYTAGEALAMDWTGAEPVPLKSLYAGTDVA